MVGNIFGAGLSGLAASRRQLDLVAQNLANVNTPGYARRSVAQYSSAVGGVGQGVVLGQVIRAIDEGLTGRLGRAATSAAGAGARDQYRASIEQLFGKPTPSKPSGGAGLGEGLAKLRETLTQFGINVGSVPPAIVVGAAHSLAGQLNSMSARIQDLRLEADQAVSGNIREINGLAEQIAALNRDVVTSKATGLSTADLEDRRDTALTSLAELTGVGYYVRADGSMAVATRTGRALVDGGRATTIGMLDSSNNLTSYAPVTVMTAVTPTHRIGLGTMGAPGSSDLTSELMQGGGKLGELLAQRGQYSATASLPQGELQYRTAELNQLALQLYGTLRAANLGTGDVPGNSSFDPGNAVNEANHVFAGVYPNPPAAPGNIDNAATIQVHPDLKANPGLLQTTNGATNIAIGKALAAAVNSKTVAFSPAGALGATTGSLSGYANTILGNVADIRASSRAEEKQATDLRQSVVARLGQSTGVNMDEELSKLTTFQKSYQASAKVLQIANDMLDTVLGLVRGR